MHSVILEKEHVHFLYYSWAAQVTCMFLRIILPFVQDPRDEFTSHVRYPAQVIWVIVHILHFFEISSFFDEPVSCWSLA